MSMNPEMDGAVTTCGNCHSPMPKELRFCRNCGFRLGEGVAEYTETVRFQDVPAGTFAGNSANSFPHGAGGAIAVSSGRKQRKRRRRMSGMTWMFLGLLIFFIAAAAFTAIKSPHNPIVRIGRPAPPPRSYFGVDGFETTDGDSGVTFANVEPPGSPADMAGLVGGDIITTADGQPVHSRDEMLEILRRTPIGKTIDIVYIRDGQTKNTKLTTFSEEDSARLSRDFAGRSVGRGRFGFDDDNTERVPIPGTQMFGVRLDDVSPSLPADMAGIKNGDIIIEFDGVPIRTPEELTSRVRRAIPYQTINVVLMRGGERLEIPVKMGKQ
jgi:membrane-associated protease RseP (regulator of RpoE activity)